MPPFLWNIKVVINSPAQSLSLWLNHKGLHPPVLSNYPPQGSLEVTEPWQRAENWGATPSPLLKTGWRPSGLLLPLFFKNTNGDSTASSPSLLCALPLLHTLVSWNLCWFLPLSVLILSPTCVSLLAVGKVLFQIRYVYLFLRSSWSKRRNGWTVFLCCCCCFVFKKSLPIQSHKWCQYTFSTGQNVCFHNPVWGRQVNHFGRALFTAVFIFFYIFLNHT